MTYESAQYATMQNTWQRAEKSNNLKSSSASFAFCVQILQQRWQVQF